jgi:AcrR family transcriptional regulator
VRVKTDARREAIIAAAAEVFGEKGFDAASISDIAARAGGSRVTLYGYFSSKEELLLEVILRTAVQLRDDAIAALLAADDAAAGLRGFGASYLKWVTSPDSLAVLRIAIAQGRDSHIGRLYHERGPGPAWDALAAFMRTSIDAGKFRAEDPRAMAMQLKALYEAGLVESLLLGVAAKVRSKDLVLQADKAVEIFLRAYRK